jgi:hypothetical protein
MTQPVVTKVNGKFVVSTGALSSEEVKTIQDNQVKMGSVGGKSATPSKFVFLGTFDGTNNDKTNVDLSGNPYQTNIANLSDQQRKGVETNPGLGGNYYKGVGTGGTDGGFVNAGPLPSGAIRTKAEEALADFSKQAMEYLDRNPGATAADISGAVAGFSRGCATAIEFMQLVNSKGLSVTNEDGTVREIAKPGEIKFNGVALLDPVFTGISGDLSIPPNVQGEVLVVRAADEMRDKFRAAEFGNDSRVVTIEEYGNHCGIGGGYDKNGTGASVLEGVTTYLQKSGIAVADVPAENKFDGSKDVAVYTEQYRLAANGDIVGDQWVMDEGGRGHRQTTPVKTPADTNNPEDPSSKAAVNGMDLDSDQSVAAKAAEDKAAADKAQDDFRRKEIEDQNKTENGSADEEPAKSAEDTYPDPEVPFTPIVATADLPPDQVLTLAAADTDDGLASDAGSGSYGNGSNSTNPTTPVAPPAATPVTAPTLNDLQNTTLNDTLATAGLNLDANNPITALPPVNGMVILANADGDIVGTVDISNAGSGGTAQFQLLGEPVQTIDRLGNSFDATTVGNLEGATNFLNFGMTLKGLENWADASDLSRVQTVFSIYNQFNGLANLNMPSMAGPASVLSFYSACQSGDALGITHSGLQMIDTVTKLTTGTGMISSAFPNLIPGLGMVMALTNIEDNPLGVVTAALNFFPPAGPLIGAFLSIAQVIFTHAPISEGEAHASFDDAGNLIVTTDSEKHGGGSTANYWMEQLAKGAQMAGLQTPQAGAYTVGMPTVGYKYNPEGFNDEDKDGEQINGHLTLRWVDPNGVAHARVYTADGNGALAWGDEKDNSIGEDFFLLMQDATKRYPPLAYEQIDGGVVQFDYGVATVVYATNTHKFDGMAEHTHGGDEDTDAALDAAIEIAEGDKRLLQDHSNTIKNTSTQTHFKVAASNLHTVVAPIIAPIQTKGDLIGVGSNKVVSNAIVTRPLGFVPLGGTDSLAQDKKNATAAMIKSADNGLFGANNIASTAMAAAAVIQWPSLASAGVPNATNPLPAAERRYGVSDLRPWDDGNGSGADNNGSANKVQEVVRPTLTSNPAGKGTVQQDINAIDASSVQLGNILGDAPVSTTSGYLIPSGVAASSLTGEGAQAVKDAGINADLILTYPKVTGELVAGTEDTGLRFSSEMLLANDSTDNGRAYSNMPSLRISAVGSPTHGQVALKDGIYYIFDSCSGSKYAGCGLKMASKTDHLNKSSVNDDLFTLAA